MKERNKNEYILKLGHGDDGRVKQGVEILVSVVYRDLPTPISIIVKVSLSSSSHLKHLQNDRRNVKWHRPTSPCATYEHFPEKNMYPNIESEMVLSIVIEVCSFSNLFFMKTLTTSIIKIVKIA